MYDSKHIYILQILISPYKIAKGIRRCITSCTARESPVPKIMVKPSQVLIDQPTKIIVQGLEPRQNMTFVAVLQNKTVPFISHAHYTADTRGYVRLSDDVSSGGSYQGTYCNYIAINLAALSMNNTWIICIIWLMINYICIVGYNPVLKAIKRWKWNDKIRLNKIIFWWYT